MNAVTPPRLYGEIQRAAVSGPLGRPLAVVHPADLAAFRAGAVHHPDVGIFHGRLRGREITRRSLEGDPGAVGRPLGTVLGTFCVGQTPDRAIGHLRGKDVVVEETIRVGPAIRHEQDLVAARRPVDGVLVVVTGRELTDLSGADVGDENVQTPVVIEPRHAFGRRWFVEIPRDDHRIAVRVCFGSWRRGDERDLATVGRPREAITGRWQRMIGPFDRRDEGETGSVRRGDHQPRLLSLAPGERDQAAVGRPHRTRRTVTADPPRLACRQRHHPQT